MKPELLSDLKKPGYHTQDKLYPSMHTNTFFCLSYCCFDQVDLSCGRVPTVEVETAGIGVFKVAFLVKVQLLITSV